MAETGPTHIGPYEIRRRIGRGGMATVYAAFDPTLQREVAIKVLSPAMTPDAVLRERFMREARVNLRLDHPAILPIHSLGEADDSVYIVMALAAGGSLEARLRRAPRLNADEVIRIIRPIAAGLDHAHGRGIVHRDLKPGNVLFTAAGEPLIADFGIARFQGDATTRLTQGVTIGTPVYLSPEQARGEPVTGSTDIYALAIMTYEMLTGEPPFTGDSPVQVMYRHLTEPLPERGLPADVQRVLERGAAKQPGERYATAADFAQELSKAASGQLVVGAVSAADPTVVSRVDPADDITRELPRVRPAAAKSMAGSHVVRTVLVVVAALLVVTLGLLWLLPGGEGDSPTRWMPIVRAALLGAIAVVLVSRVLRRRAERRAAETEAPTAQVADAAPVKEASRPPRTAGPSSETAWSQVLEPGQRLAEYRIIERLDEGNRTRVYHAFDEKRERDVALRVISLDAEAPDRVQRLRREASLLGRLHHAHIVPFFDFGTTPASSYIVMPLLGGRSLETRIRTAGRLPVPDTVELTRQIAGALHYLHGEGIVSRDLKPSGMVFDRHDNLYLADLRIAKDLAEPEDVRLTMVGQPLGTPTYMSPEQFLGDHITPAADQYILACLVFEMLTGRRPFDADSPFALMLKHVREEPPSLSSLRDDVPDDLDDTLATALAKDPARRFPDVMTFHERLAEACAAGSPRGEAPADTRAGHVFISYSREDGEFAHRLADELRRRGLDVWIDARLEPSDQWWRVIVDAIDTCAAFVAIMSPSANGSKWVEREVLLADQRGKAPFPLLLDGQAFPIYVGTQYVDVRGETLPDEAFFERLAKVVGGPAVR